jgi:hypothetical protein
VAQSAKQALAVCEQKGTDKVQLEYDSRNPFDLCSLTFTPIYRGNQYAEDPYTKARCAPKTCMSTYELHIPFVSPEKRRARSLSLACRKTILCRWKPLAPASILHLVPA